MSNQVPTDIEDFCMQHGFAAYIGMMRENEVDLVQDMVDECQQEYSDLMMRETDEEYNCNLKIIDDVFLNNSNGAFFRRQRAA